MSVLSRPHANLIVRGSLSLAFIVLLSVSCRDTPSTPATWTVEPGLVLQASAPSANDAGGININNMFHMSSAEQDEMIQELVDYGVGWIRIMFDWCSFEVEEGNRFWLQDSLISKANAAGLKILVTAGYAPLWATEETYHDPHAFCADVKWALPDMEAWGDFIEAAMDHHFDPQHGGALEFHALGIWNEANADIWFEGSAADYAQLIEYAAPHAQAHQIPLVGGHVATHWGPGATQGNFTTEAEEAGNAAWQQWLGDVMDLQGHNVDIIAIHAYHDAPYVQWKVEWVLNEWDRPVWVAETGVHAYDTIAAFLNPELQSRQLREVLAATTSTADWDRTFAYDFYGHEMFALTERPGMCSYLYPYVPEPRCCREHLRVQTVDQFGNPAPGVLTQLYFTHDLWEEQHTSHPGGYADFFDLPAEPYTYGVRAYSTWPYDTGGANPQYEDGIKLECNESGLYHVFEMVDIRYPPPSVTIQGPDQVQTHQHCAWSASVSDGEPPMEYEWRRDGQIVSQANSYETWDTGSASFQLEVTVTDANEQVGSDHQTVQVEGSGQFTCQ